VRSARESELRRLRKANIEFEEQNAVLQRHIKDMYSAKERLEAELGLDEKRTQALHQNLLTIKHTLVNSLSSVPLPGEHSDGRLPLCSLRGIEGLILPRFFLNRHRRDGVSREPGLLPKLSQRSAGGKPSQAPRAAQPALRSPGSPGQVTDVPHAHAAGAEM